MMRNHRYHLSATPVAALALVLLCLCSLLHIIEAGGKGKGGRQGHIIIQNEVKDRGPGTISKTMPIYMPIPIPIPMPMGPAGGGGGGGKFHHGQHGADEEGEVKKIYLLQPMPKVHPQPHLKGGGLIGPVQTHIHMQPAAPPVQQHQHQKRNHEGDSGDQQHHHHHHSKSQHHSELKILPIVVIPPMAPMPPIQVTPTNSNQHAPRMTLSPHFHNYLVAGSETGGHHHKKGSSYSPTSHSLSLLQDHKSFSDYGGSGGGALYRERVVSSDPKRLGRRATTGVGSARSASDYSGQGSRLRSVIFDDYGDNDYGDSQQPQQSHVYSRRQLRDRPVRYGQSRRRNYQQVNEQPAASRLSGGRLSVDSIRDIVEQQQQQSLFDDDPYFEPNDLSESRTGDCCNERRTGRGSSSQPLEASSELPSLSPPVDLRDYELTSSDGKRNSFRSSQHLSDAARLDELAAAGERDLSSLVHYDRDFQLTEQRPSRLRSSSIGGGRRLYLDSREILNDDDEWRLDSLKSVTHVSSLVEVATNHSMTDLSNSTITATTVLVNSTDTKSGADFITTTTLQPPVNIASSVAVESEATV